MNAPRMLIPPHTFIYLPFSQKIKKFEVGMTCIPNVLKPNESFQNLTYMYKMMISNIYFLPFKEGKYSLCQVSFPEATRTIAIFSM